MRKDKKSHEVALKVHRLRYGHDGRREYFVTRGFEEHGLLLDAVALPLEEFEAPEGHVCLAYPLLGKDLNRCIEEAGRPFPVGEARRIARKTLGFLAAFHRTGAAHTDIKPDNFLFDAASGGVRLIDFGNLLRKELPETITSVFPRA